MKFFLEKYKSILYSIDTLAAIAGIGLGAVLGVIFFSETISDVLAISCIFGVMFTGVAMLFHINKS